jgi:hypothetical protein
MKKKIGNKLFSAIFSNQFYLHKSSTRDELDHKNKFSNLAGYTPLKYLLFGKPLITPEPRLGKFQKFVEMKVSYPTDKGNASEDFSNNLENFTFNIT